MAAPTVLTYDPSQFSMIVGAQIASGFADDTMIEVERDEDAYSKKVGTDGEVTRGKNNNRTGKVRIYLMQSSGFNDYLTSLALLDEASNSGGVPVLAKDTSGRSAFATDFAWVKKFPKAVFKKGVEVWMWEMDCGNITIFMGGN